MNNQHWQRRTTIRRSQTKRNLSFLPEKMNRITVGFPPNYPILLKVQIRATEKVMGTETTTTMTDAGLRAGFPGPG